MAPGGYLTVATGVVQGSVRRSRSACRYGVVAVIEPASVAARFWEASAAGGTIIAAKRLVAPGCPSNVDCSSKSDLITRGAPAAIRSIAAMQLASSPKQSPAQPPS